MVHVSEWIGQIAVAVVASRTKNERIAQLIDLSHQMYSDPENQTTERKNRRPSLIRLSPVGAPSWIGWANP